ncbi:MAG: glycosyl transferase [Acidimicrobiia bacterium]|nr:MAG: glycosyl transferase [Acidimicrobiia bacterium]
MRILHVNKFLYRRGGAEAYMADLAALQERSGDTVAFFGMAHPDNERSELADTFPGHVEFGTGASGLDRLRAVPRMLWSVGAARGITAAVARFRPDVVHFHNVYHQLSPSVIDAVARRGVPSVMTVHDYKLVCPNYQLLAGGARCTDCVGGSLRSPLTRRCKSGSLAASALLAAETALHRRLRVYDRLGALVAPSRFLADLLTASAPTRVPVRHVPHFVGGPGRPGAPPGPDLPEPGLVVYAGRLAPEKGVDVLVEAAAALPGARVDVAGDGPARADLERLARDAGVTNVRFLGHLAAGDLARLLRRATVVAVPSRWYENQPLAVLEAFAAGRPVVASALGGIPELVEPGRDGFLVPPDDPRRLAATLARVLHDPALARAMGRAARARIARDHDSATHLERIAACYDLAARRLHAAEARV